MTESSRVSSSSIPGPAGLTLSGEAETSPARTPGFIVGMSRAGTSWLAEALHRHPQVAVFGESAFWGRHYVAPSADGRYGPAALDDIRRSSGSSHMRTARPGGVDVAALLRLVLDEAESSGERPTPRDVFDALARTVSHTEDAPVIIEKTPHHVNWLGRIRHVYPDALAIVMMREPYGFMRSYKHQGDRKRADVRDRFQKRYHPIACALVYRRSLASAQRCLAMPDTCRVDFDAIRRTPGDVLAGVQTFLGLEPVDIIGPPSNSSFPSGVRPQLDPVDVFWMNRVAGRQIRHAGYSMQPSGARPGAVAHSLLRLPQWIGTLRKDKNLSLRYLLRWLR